MTGYKKHRCKEFEKAVALYYSDNEEWQILSNKGGSIISVCSQEYGIEINYCPFCGKKPLLKKSEVKKNEEKV